MKALVTGGTGFIGSYVIRSLLDENHEVRIFSRRKDLPESFRNARIEIATGDLEDTRSLLDALSGIDVFYHIGEIKNTSKAASERNVRLVEEVIGCLKEKNVQRIVFVSSITVSGIPSSIPADEMTEPRLILHDHYTEYKKQCEDILRNNSECEYVIIRPAPVYGPGSRYLGRFVNILGWLGPVGFPFVGNAENLAPLIEVRDLAQAIYSAGIKPAAAGQMFVLTDGFRHSWFEFLQAITEGLGKRLRIIPVLPAFLKITALPLDLFSGFLGVSIDPLSYITYFSQDLYFDNAKAKKLLDWAPRYSLAEGVRDMLPAYKRT